MNRSDRAIHPSYRACITVPLLAAAITALAVSPASAQLEFRQVFVPPQGDVSAVIVAPSAAPTVVVAQGGSPAAVIPQPPPGGASVIVAPGSPPAPATEIISPPATTTAQSFDWQAGHWEQNGSVRSWVPGQYVPRSPPGAVWVPGRWQQQSSDDPYTWIAGHWS